MPTDVLELATRGQMRLDIRAHLPDHFLPHRQRRPVEHLFELSQSIRLVIRHTAEHDAINVLQMILHICHALDAAVDDDLKRWKSRFN